MSDVDNTVDNTVTRPGANGGRLKTGNLGNRGGPGRPPSEIRQLCAEKFYKHVPKAEAILRSKQSSDADKLRALDLLGKYGGLQKIETATRDETLEDLLREAAASDRGDALTPPRPDSIETRDARLCHHERHRSP
jgi:hypothetical protein